MTATLQALVKAAVDATGADGGAVYAIGDELAVVAVGGNVAESLLGRSTSSEASSARFVAASGQPMAVTVRPGDTRLSSLGELMGPTPASVLAVPCLAGDDPIGVLELVDRRGGPFSIDDIEIATLLSGIVGVVLSEGGSPEPSLPDPADLAAELARLARQDRPRYRAAATVLLALLDRG